MCHPSGCYAKLLRILQLSKFTFFNAKIWLQLLRVPYNTPTNGNATRQGYDWRHTPRSGSTSAMSGQPTAQGTARSRDCRTPFRLCFWRHRSLRSRCLPTLRLHCGGKLSIVCADTLLYSLPRQIRVALSARQLLPTPFANALRITAHRHSPHKWRDRCSRKVKIPLADFDFHGSDFTAHRLGVGAYNATENEVGAVVFHWAVGGHKSRTRGAAPYPVITYKSTL